MYGTVNPTFENRAIPDLSFIRTNIHCLENSLLRFQIRDYDRLNRNDVIAYGLIPIYDFVQKETVGHWVDFDINLILNGKPAGQMHGKAKLIIKSVSGENKA